MTECDANWMDDFELSVNYAYSCVILKKYEERKRENCQNEEKKPSRVEITIQNIPYIIEIV